jgi:hypothetical protein
MLSIFKHHGSLILRVPILIDEKTSTAVMENYFRKESPESNIVKQIAKLAIIEDLGEKGIWWVVPLKEFNSAAKDLENY